MLSWASTALLVGLWASTPDATMATPEKLAVLPLTIEGGSGETSLSTIIDAVASAAALRPGLELVSEEELFALKQGDLKAKVQACGLDDACICEHLRSSGMDLGLLVVLSFDLSPPLASVILLDGKTNKRVAESLTELKDGRPEAIAERIQTQARLGLDEAGYQQMGRLRVQVEPAAAQIRVGEGATPDPVAPGTFLLAPGSYEVRASHPGWSEARERVFVQAGEDAELAIALQEETSIFNSPWFWTAVGVAVVGSVTAAALATRSTERCLCITRDGEGCTCPE